MTRRKKLLVSCGIIVVAAITFIYMFRQSFIRKFFEPTNSSVPVNELKEEGKAKISIIAKNLNVPWDTAVLPDGDMLVTERTGTLRRIGKSGRIFTIEGVASVGEGGLLGLALHPKFTENAFVYLYLTSENGDMLINRVERYKLDNDQLLDKTEILNNIPGARNHDGGQIEFGPDGKLYITTGDAGNTELAQDKNSLAGKILRVNDDRSLPDNNPFGNPIYSYGHRNVQGIAWDNEGKLWATEHGPSGTASGFDELNLIQKGGNYGWPHTKGDEKQEGMIQPVVHSGENDTWAPGGIAYSDGALYFSGLRGERLYRAVILPSDKVSLSSFFAKEYGRLRGATVHDDYLYITTSNTDGRGEPKQGDDKVLGIPMSLLR